MHIYVQHPKMCGNLPDAVIITAALINFPCFYPVHDQKSISSHDFIHRWNEGKLFSDDKVVCMSVVMRSGQMADLQPLNWSKYPREWLILHVNFAFSAARVSAEPQKFFILVTWGIVLSFSCLRQVFFSFCVYESTDMSEPSWTLCKLELKQKLG